MRITWLNFLVAVLATIGALVLLNLFLARNVTGSVKVSVPGDVPGRGIFEP